MAAKRGSGCGKELQWTVSDQEKPRNVGFYNYERNREL
jgi:hypothetical protein